MKFVIINQLKTPSAFSPNIYSCSKPSCLELPSQKAHSFRNSLDIVQMSRQNSQSSSAHRIARVANDQQLVRRKVRDLATILQILRIAKGDHTNDLVHDAGGETFNGAMNKGCSLTNCSVSLKAN